MKIKWGIAGRRLDGEPYNSTNNVTPLSGNWYLYKREIYDDKETALKRIKQATVNVVIKTHEYKIIRVHDNE